MDYKLALKLKEVGFPQDEKELTCSCGITCCEIHDDYEKAYIPTLSELIEACGDEFRALRLDSSMKTENNEQWACDRVEHGVFETFIGKTPEESVARLYIKLNKK